jgi:hypothetical protein
MTLLGHPNFNSYIKNLRVLVFQTYQRMDRWMDGLMDRQTEINPGWALQPLGSSK